MFGGDEINGSASAPGNTMRLESWDYAKAGLYFITICTHLKEYRLENDLDNILSLSPIGEKAQQYWLEIPKHFINVALDEFVIMPNHIHGLIVIKKLQGDNSGIGDAGGRYVGPLHKRKKGLPPGSIGAIINSFKAAVTRWCNRNVHQFFTWKENYPDLIVRNRYEFKAYRQFIINNPRNWFYDIHNPRRIK